LGDDDDDDNDNDTVGQELPDDYFTPTLADIKVRQQQLHARTVSLNNAPSLAKCTPLFCSPNRCGTHQSSHVF
jgi:hypothetical protein